VSAVIPVKRLDRALGRLSGVLPREARRELQEAMLTDVLAACAGARRMREVIVVTADPHARAMARAHGARWLPDHAPPRGMNAAVSVGLAAARGAALVLTADLPLVRADDLDQVVEAAPAAPGVCLVASAAGTGTNAMLIRPPEALVPRLGPDSLARHLAQAERRGLRVALIQHPRIGLDVDTPDDLVALWAAGPTGATRAVLARIGVADLARASAQPA
jgi:2-phospho-L-lactate guanylyltransferase